MASAIPSKLVVANELRKMNAKILGLRDDQVFISENVHDEIKAIKLLGRILTNVFIIDCNIEPLKNDPVYVNVLTQLRLFTDRFSLIPEIKEIQVEVQLFTGMMPTQ